MKIFDKILPATSLLETIVSSVIFMILFLIAMHSLTYFVMFENRSPNLVNVYSDMKNCKNMIEKEWITESTRERFYYFPWGEIKITATPYRDNVWLINMNMENGNGSTVHYYFLHVNKQHE